MLRRVPVVATTAIALGACASGATRFDQGLAFYRSGQYSAARDSFSAVIQEQPQWPAAWTNRGVARARLGDSAGAVEDFSQALRLNPKDADTYLNRGNVLALGGHDTQAIGDYTHAIKLNPGLARAYFNRGTALAAIGDRAAAEADWRHALDIEADPSTRASMSQHLAAALARPAVPDKRDVAPVPMPAAAPAPPPPLDAPALVNRAVGRELDGDHAGALEDVRAALALETDPERRASLQGLLRSLEAPR